MSSRSTITLTIILCLAALAPASSAKLPEGGPIAVAGQLINEGGEPIPHAEVQLQPLRSDFELALTELGPPDGATGPAERTGLAGLAETTAAAGLRTSSDSEGFFRLLAPRPGMWKLVVRASGFVPAEHRLVPLLDAAQLPPLRLSVDRRLTPRVTDAENRSETGSHLRFGIADAAGEVTLPRAAGEEVRVQAAAPWELHGRVVERGSRLPIADAVVWPAGRPAGFVLTDNQGKFTLSFPATEVLPAIRAAARNYLDARVETSHQQAAADRSLMLALAPATVATGVVVDSAGRPIAGATITAVPNSTAEGGGLRCGTAVDGRFRLTSLALGDSYSLQANHRGFAPVRREFHTAPDREAGAILDLRIVMTRGRKIHGLVKDSAERPVAGAEVTLHPLFQEQLSRSFLALEDSGATSEETGYFEIRHVPAGSFNLLAKRSGYAPTLVPAVAIPEGEGPADIGTLLLAAGVALEVQIVDPQDRGIAGAEVRVVNPGGLENGAASGREQGLADSISDADGRVWVEDLRAGQKVSLRVRRAGYAPLSVSGVEAPLADPLSLTLRPASRVSGVVLDANDDPIAGALLSLRRAQTPSIGGAGASRLRSRHGAISGPQGRFEIAEAEPGKWVLLARAPGFQDSDLSPLETTAGHDLEEVRVVLAAGAALTGRVSGPTGEGVPEATVQLLTEDPTDSGYGKSALTDEEGSYRLEGLHPGRASIAVLHPSYPRTVEDLWIRQGEAVFDAVLEPGWELAGQVVDAAGRPLERSRVYVATSSTLLAAVKDAHTAADGSFTITGLGDGSYRLRAERLGYATGETQEPIQVEGASVFGLEIQLPAGSTVAGRVLGLGFDQLAEVRVTAHREQPSLFSGQVQVNYEGEYRLDNLAPGEWQVTAGLGSRRAEARASLSAEVPEVELDLEFSDGLTLDGEVWYHGENVSGARVFLDGRDLSASLSVGTDYRGVFRFEGLEVGSYTVRVTDATSYLSHREELELRGHQNLSIELTAARLSGVVLDGSDFSPVAGARVILGGEGESTLAAAVSRWETRTDGNGRFALEGVGAGSHRLSVRKAGYALAESSVAVADGETRDDLRLLIDATEGLTLEVSTPSGRPADRIWLTLLNLAGRVVHSGRYSTGENGRVHLSEVADGEWEMIVGAEGAAATSRLVRIPSGLQSGQAGAAPLAIQLQRSASFAITVPELTTSDRPASLRIASPDGRPFRAIGGQGILAERWRVLGGKLELEGLPPGSWTLVVQTPDARIWQGSAATVAGQVTEVVLE